MGVGDLIDEAAAPLANGKRGRIAQGPQRRRVKEQRVPNLRLKTDNITHAVHLVPRGGADLADRVHEAHTGHPLIRSELNLAGKIVQVLEQGGENLPVAWRDIGAHGLADQAREVGVELGLGGGHFGGGGAKGTKVGGKN